MKGNLGSDTYHDEANCNRNTSDFDNVFLKEIEQGSGTVLQVKITQCHLYDIYCKCPNDMLSYILFSKQFVEILLT